MFVNVKKKYFKLHTGFKQFNGILKNLILKKKPLNLFVNNKSEISQHLRRAIGNSRNLIDSTQY